MRATSFTTVNKTELIKTIDSLQSRLDAVTMAHQETKKELWEAQEAHKATLKELQRERAERNNYYQLAQDLIIIAKRLASQPGD